MVFSVANKFFLYAIMADGEERRFTRSNRGARMAVLLSEAHDAQAGGILMALPLLCD